MSVPEAELRPVIATSTTEAEFYSLRFTAPQAIALQFLLEGVARNSGDQGSEWAHQPGGRWQADEDWVVPIHVRVQYPWVQSLVEDGSIVLAMVPGEEHRSDTTTKRPPAAKQREFLEKLAGLRVSGRTILLSVETQREDP